MDLKKIYYYIICLITFFVFMWGIVDIVSATFSLTIFKAESVSLEPVPGIEGMSAERGGTAEPLIEDYYQRRMIYDRMGDSLARIIIAGAIFAYARWKIFKFEKG